MPLAFTLENRMNSRNYTGQHTVLFSKSWMNAPQVNGRFIPPRMGALKLKIGVPNLFTNTRVLDFFNRLFAPGVLAQVKRTRLGGLS